MKTQDLFQPRMENVLDFVRLTHQFRNIRRQIFNTGQPGVWENNAEHIAQLSMIVWFAGHKMDGLNMLQSQKFVFVHDVPELHHSGGFDVSSYTSSFNERELKDHREEETVKALHQRLSYFPEFLEALTDYRRMDTPEAKFVYAWDKFLPMLNIYLDNGLTWKEFGVTLEDIIREKAHKIALHPAVDTLFREMLVEFERRKDTLFANRYTSGKQLVMFDENGRSTLDQAPTEKVLGFPMVA